CTLQVLKRLGNLIIDIHGPEEHQSLHSRERQMTMLDAYAATQTELQKYHFAYQQWKDAIAAVENFKTYGQADDREIQLLRFQLEEISRASLIEEELAELERRYSQARNAARLIDAASQSRSLLQAAIEDLAVARRHLSEVEQLDPESAHFTANFDSARLEIEELDNCLDQYLGGLEIDPSAMAAMERRIDEVENLKRKYGRTILEVLAFEKEARNRLDKIDHREEEMERLAEAVSKALIKMQKAGAKLSKKRKLAAPRLQQKIKDHLKGLGFTRADFEVALPTHETPQFSGLENVDFLFGPNPGEPVKPLRTIASSGEMSRVMLAVKSALASQDDTPLMVFDEIDANVGGEIAVAVGEKMATLGKQHQVIAITHMPQVASLANSHFHVSKKTKGKSTVTGIRKLENQDRIAELARMLGGVGEESFALAEKLLQGNDMAHPAN
ncbi:MAG: DNA repair protein RecN, partial [Verrucomicrobiales bacterium]|nr:DNA repair protein RecN [Verrucomicrobiales bacterium]